MMRLNESSMMKERLCIFIFKINTMFIYLHPAQGAVHNTSPHIWWDPASLHGSFQIHVHLISYSAQCHYCGIVPHGERVE